MPTHVKTPTRIEAAGNKPKLIDEYIGAVNSRHHHLSVAHMRSPGGWVEPGQTPQFEEYTVVLKGLLRVTHAGGVLDVRAGQAVIAHPGEWVKYSTPEPEGAEYIAVCLPAFSPHATRNDANSGFEYPPWISEIQLDTTSKNCDLWNRGRCLLASRFRAGFRWRPKFATRLNEVLGGRVTRPCYISLAMSVESSCGPEKTSATWSKSRPSPPTIRRN